MRKLCLDLCSGMGGFSSAFRGDPGWHVITIDIDAKLEPDMVLDLVEVMEHPESHQDFWGLRPDLVLASPPCERWSIANPQWPKEGIYASAKVLGAVLEIIARMKPRGWVIENPKGRMRWFLGKPRMTINLNQFGYRTVKPTDFWTNIDIGMLRYTGRYNINGIRFDKDMPRSSKKRAEMPYGLSQKILESMEEALK